MSGIIKAYSTEQSGPTGGETITQTNIAGNKHALDVAVKESVAVTGTVTTSGLTIAGVNTRVGPLSTATWTILPKLSDRNAMLIQNDTAGTPNTDDIVMDFVNTGVVTDGIVIKATGAQFLDITDSIDVYVRAVSGTPTITIMEVS